ncbi:MAG: iron ABC transporter permease [Lawsonibacter sp.]
MLAAALSLAAGPVVLSPGELWAALIGRSCGTAGTILLHTRLPRTCACLLAGAALAVSGAIIQSVLANPLAAPNIIGVNAGAGLMVALACALAPTALALTPVLAFLGAMAGVLLVLAIARRTGASRLTVALAGVAVSSVFNAGIDAVVTFVPDTLNSYADFRVGSLANLTLDRILPAGALIVIALILALTLAGEMDVLLLGEDVARSLGLNAGRSRMVLLAVAAALAGAAVSFAGLLGFVGLIVPAHAAAGGGGQPAAAGGFGPGGRGPADLLRLASRTLLFAPYELPQWGLSCPWGAGPFSSGCCSEQRGGRTPWSRAAGSCGRATPGGGSS